MKKEPNVFIEHILESIVLIESYSKGVSQAAFFKNRSVQDAIIRRLEMIGEAVKNLPMSVRALSLPQRQAVWDVLPAVSCGAETGNGVAAHALALCGVCAGFARLH